MRALLIVLFFLGSVFTVSADNGADDPQYEPSVGEGVGVAVSCAVVIPLVPLVGVIMCACQQRVFNAGLDPDLCRERLMTRRQ